MGDWYTNRADCLVKYRAWPIEVVRVDGTQSVPHLPPGTSILNEATISSERSKAGGHVYFSVFSNGQTRVYHPSPPSKRLRKRQTFRP